MGVFDGHGNEQLSHWLSANFSQIFFKVFAIFQQSFGLPHCIGYVRKLFPSEESYKSRCSRLYALNCPEFISLSLSTSFALCEELAMNIAHVDTAHGGSCATVVAVTRSGFYAAKVGDCSASLVTVPACVILKTSDHRPSTRPDEVHRVTSLGGLVYKGNSVGMAFSSLNVTRSLGDTLWRANDDWKRDKTREASNSAALAVDESLSSFSRTKGCVGVSSDPEWYSCQCVKQEEEEENPFSFHWQVSTNSPDKTPSVKPRRFEQGAPSFFLVIGSDGFWETSANSAILQRLCSAKKIPSVPELMEIAKDHIGSAPHDDSTVLIAKLDVDPTLLTPPEEARGGSDGEGSNRRARRSNKDPLDYLFK